MFSGTFKFGSILSISFVLIAYIYKRKADEALQGRLKDVLSGLLRAERKVTLQPKKVAVGFGGCEDIFTEGLELLKLMNFSAPGEAFHQDVVNNSDELLQLFAYFFQYGAAAERYVANDSLFDALVENGAKVPGHRWALGGNAPAMARRFALEGLDVLLGARVAHTVVEALPKSVKVIGKIVPKSDIHLLMEYNTNDKWGQYVSPRANRLILHSDGINPFLDGMEEFIEEVVTFQPQLVVIGGLQMMDNFPYEKGVRQKRLNKLRQFLQDLPRSTHVHFEMASFTDMTLLKEILENVIYYADSLGANEQFLHVSYILHVNFFLVTLEKAFCGRNIRCLLSLSLREFSHTTFLPPQYYADSLGANEQELPNIISAIQGENVSLVSESYPRVASVLDQMRKLYNLLKDTEETEGRRKLTRVHIHTLAFQAIMASKESAWTNTMSAAAKAALTAHRYTCGEHDVDTLKARLIMDESFSLSTNVVDSQRMHVNDTRPVSCWQESDYELCLAPVLVCTQILQTGGGGDNVSSAGLVLQI